MQERIRKRYAKTKMAIHRRRMLRRWAAWNRYESFKARLYVGFKVKPRRYYWHKKRLPLTEETLVDAIRKVQALTDKEPGKFFINLGR